MEALKTLESNDSLQNNPEKHKEAISKETDRLFDTLDSPDVSVWDIHFLIDNLSSSNPNFAKNWSEFQNKNSLILQNELSKSSVVENLENTDSLPQINYSKDIIATNEKYSFLSQYLENITIWKWEIQTLSHELYSALNRYSQNKKPLLNILWSEEKVKDFFDFLTSNKWSLILNFTQYYSNIKVIWENLQIVNLDTNEPGKILSNEILNQTQDLAERISKHQNTLQNELKAQKENQNVKWAIMTGNYSTYEWSNYSFNNFEKKVTNELYSYSKNVFVSILSSPWAWDLVKSWEKFRLPIWENSITLDFSQLSKWIDFENLTDTQIKNLTEKYFDDVYVDNFSEKFLDILEKIKDYASNHPEKLKVDVVSIIISWLVAVWTVATVSWATGMTWTIPSIALAWASFTASDNAIRAFGYGVIWKMWWDEIDGEKSFWDWALEWIWLKNEDLNLETVVTKKWFETLSNTVLFGIFNRTGRISEIWMKALEWKWLQLSLLNNQKVMLEAWKTIPESVFFTYYGVWASAIEDTILKMQEENWLNRDEAIDNLISNLWSITDAETFTHYFMYNLGFISLVKLGWAGWQTKVEAHLKDRPWKVNINSLIENSTKLDMELLKLQEKWYSFNREQSGEVVFYDKNLNRVDVMHSDFANLRTIQESLMVNNLNIQRLLLDDFSNSPLPNSWKWTKAQANKPEIQVKYERLEKLSREAEKQGLSFALDKDNIYDWVSKSWVKEWTKDWLLKEAWFTNTEREAIKKQEVNEGSKKLEDRAVERMNSAVEKISREYDKVFEILLNSKDLQSFSDTLLKNWYSQREIIKLRNILDL